MKANPKINRLPIIGVMGSGKIEDAFPFARSIGELIARKGYHILTGGGFGVMQAASEGFASVQNRRGMIIGVLPAREIMTTEFFDEYPNEFVEITIQTHLVRDGDSNDPMTRNHINILTSNVLVFCPGNIGTHSELDIVKKYNKPAILYMGDSGTINGMNRSTLESYDLPFANSLDELDNFLQEFT